VQSPGSGKHGITVTYSGGQRAGWAWPETLLLQSPHYAVLFSPPLFHPLVGDLAIMSPRCDIKESPSGEFNNQECSSNSSKPRAWPQACHLTLRNQFLHMLCEGAVACSRDKDQGSQTPFNNNKNEHKNISLLISNSYET
jgi:hypothetical protein